MGAHSYETRDLDREGRAQLRARLFNRTPKHAGEFAARAYEQGRSRFIAHSEAMQSMNDHLDIAIHSTEALTKLADKFGGETVAEAAQALHEHARIVGKIMLNEMYGKTRQPNPNYFVHHMPMKEARIMYPGMTPREMADESIRNLGMNPEDMR